MTHITLDIQLPTIQNGGYLREHMKSQATLRDRLPVNLGCRPRLALFFASDTLVMRRSLGGDEDQCAEAPTVVRDRRRCARCVPDRPVNAGKSRSLPDSPVHGSPAHRQADPLRKPTF